MKKVLSIFLVIALVLGMTAITALADTAYNGEVHGVISVDEHGVITGTLTGAYTITVNGSVTGGSGQTATFAGTFSGDIAGAVSGKMNINGNDSLYADITGTDASDDVYLIGGFPPCGINNYFEGKIVTGTKPAGVTDVTISTAEGVFEAPVGGTLHMQVDSPAGYQVRWGVYVNDRAAGYARIDKDGTLHILSMPADGDIIVMANTLDPNVYSENITISVVNPSTLVKASVDPTYTIIIPASVNFGALIKGSGIATQPFDVKAQGMVIGANASIDVTVNSPFNMNDGNTPPEILAYSLFNVSSGGSALTPNTDAAFASFTADGIQNGRVEVDTDAIAKAGSYSGIMTFTITYVPAP